MLTIRRTPHLPHLFTTSPSSAGLGLYQPALLCLPRPQVLPLIMATKPRRPLETAKMPAGHLAGDNPDFDPGRTTQSDDMARYAYEHRLWSIAKPPKLSLHDHQTQNTTGLPCSLYVRGEQLKLVDAEDMPLLFCVAIDSLRPRLSVELRFWPRSRDNDPASYVRYNDCRQRIKLE